MAYTMEELSREGRRIADTLHGGFLQVRVAGPSPDLTHVVVWVHPGGVAEAEARGVDPADLIDSPYPVKVVGESNPVLAKAPAGLRGPRPSPSSGA